MPALQMDFTNGSLVGDRRACADGGADRPEVASASRESRLFCTMPASSVWRDEAVTTDPCAAGLQTCGHLPAVIQRITKSDGDSAAEPAPAETSPEARCDQRGSRHWLTVRALCGAIAIYAPANSCLGTSASGSDDGRAPRPALRVHTVIRAAAGADTADCTDATAPHTFGWRQDKLGSRKAVKSLKMQNVLTAAPSCTESVWTFSNGRLTRAVQQNQARGGKSASTLIDLTTCLESDLQNMPHSPSATVQHSSAQSPCALCVGMGFAQLD